MKELPYRKTVSSSSMRRIGMPRLLSFGESELIKTLRKVNGSTVYEGPGVYISSLKPELSRELLVVRTTTRAQIISWRQSLQFYGDYYIPAPTRLDLMHLTSSVISTRNRFLVGGRVKRMSFYSMMGTYNSSLSAVCRLVPFITLSWGQNRRPPRSKDPVEARIVLRNLCPLEVSLDCTFVNRLCQTPVLPGWMACMQPTPLSKW